LLTCLLAGSLLFPARAMSQDKINPFRQPSQTTRFYGSGDTNSDGKVDSVDYNIMTASSPKIDEADIDGDGTPSTSNDKLILNQHLTQGAKLPSNWQNITRAERESWLKKMIAVDKTDTLHYVSGQWESANFAKQTHLNFSGAGNYVFHPEDATFKYDTTKIKRFNLPLYYTTRSASTGGHGMNAILVGDNPKDWNDWSFVEPQTDQIVQPGSQSIPLNSKVNIINLSWFYEPSLKRNLATENDFLTFTIVNGVPTLASYDTTRLVLDRNFNSLPTQPTFTNIKDNDTVRFNSGKLNVKYTKATDADNDLLTYLVKVKGPGLDTIVATQNDSVSIRDKAFQPTSKYTLEGKVTDGRDTVNFTNSNIEFFTPTVTDVKRLDELKVPAKYGLSQNYPNPFNPATSIKYNLPKTTNVSLKVYDVLGREVETLADGVFPAGEYTAGFDASKLSSGVYFYRLKAGDFAETKKMVVNK
ncbi:MAG: T9SS type A sorting domain-containing protein, partial [Nanoarchaeota archaeon]